MQTEKIVNSEESKLLAYNKQTVELCPISESKKMRILDACNQVFSNPENKLSTIYSRFSLLSHLVSIRSIKPLSDQEEIDSEATNEFCGKPIDDAVKDFIECTEEEKERCHSPNCKEVRGCYLYEIFSNMMKEKSSLGKIYLKRI